MAVLAAVSLLAGNPRPARAGAGEGEGGGHGDGGDVASAPQRRFAFGPTVGTWAGEGLVVGGGGDSVKARVAAGYAPVLVFANARTADKSLRFNYYGAYQLSGDVVLRLFSRGPTQLGLLLGYKFNSVLGHGAGAGFGVLYDLGGRLSVDLSAGLAVYPSAQDRLDHDHAYPADRSPALPPALQGGASVALLFYP